MDKLNTKAYTTTQLSPREKNILAFIESHPGSKSSEIAEKLNIPLSTVKKNLTSMVENKMAFKYGNGAGTNYIAETKSPLKQDLMFQLTNANRKKEFLLMNSSSFIEIKKIILTPLFLWVKPDEWAAKLVNHGLNFKITGNTDRGSFSSIHSLIALNNPYYFQPVFTLNTPINISQNVNGRTPNLNNYPIKIEIELCGSVPTFEFDFMFVYDEV